MVVVVGEAEEEVEVEGMEGGGRVRGAVEEAEGVVAAGDAVPATIRTTVRGRGVGVAAHGGRGTVERVLLGIVWVSERSRQDVPICRDDEETPAQHTSSQSRRESCAHRERELCSVGDISTMLSKADLAERTHTITRQVSPRKGKYVSFYAPTPTIRKQK